MTDPINSKHASALTRRRWLQAGAALGAGAAWLPQAQAQSSYRALVCVFLYGGNDGLNCIVPTDARYAAYAAGRKQLAVAQSALKPLDGVPFGLHPSLAALQPIWNAGRMNAVLNVGPLVRPFANRDDYLTQLAIHGEVPPRLFSHSDQQTQWQAADQEAYSRSGWGGRAMSALGNNRAVMSFGGNTHFGNTAMTGALVLPGPGNSFQAEGLLASPTDKVGLARRAAFDKLYANKAQRNEMTEVFVTQQTAAMQTSTLLSPVVRSKPDELAAGDAIRTAFAPLTANNAMANPLARQLFQVAKMIRFGQSNGVGRDVFFVELGGFDTHGDQTTRHPVLLNTLAEALVAFDAAMQGLNLGQAVTTFTESDFGRTFAVNQSNGTDHGWGNMHFVLGGAVKAKATFGTYPSLQLGGADDAGKETWEHQGRWIPSASVEQYASTLLTWLGAADAQLAQVLPGLAKFPSKNLGFMV